MLWIELGEWMRGTRLKSKESFMIVDVKGLQIEQIGRQRR